MTVALNDPNGTSDSPYVPPQQGGIVPLLQIDNSMAVFARESRPSGIVSL